MGSGEARAGLKGCRWGPARTSSDVSGEGPQRRSPGARAALASRLPKCTRSDGWGENSQAGKRAVVGGALPCPSWEWGERGKGQQGAQGDWRGERKFQGSDGARWAWRGSAEDETVSVLKGGAFQHRVVDPQAWKSTPTQTSPGTRKSTQNGSKMQM